MSASIDLTPGFRIRPQDQRLGGVHSPRSSPIASPASPPLGVLTNFTGTFKGNGFNLIFRPNSGETKFPNPLGPAPANDNVLELNLTTESLAFSGPLGDVPNRGLEKQTDIHLNGVSYVQVVNDVTNPMTGKPDNLPPSQIHFEPGLWMHVPKTTIDPDLGESLTRMASIPHGTTINAQCLNPASGTPGPPPFTDLSKISAVDITPFNSGGKIRFPSQTASATNTARLPQNLTPFIKTGTITQAILDNPNLVLANAIKGQKITNTIVFTVSTKPTSPFLAGGTANIDFLQGSSTTKVQTGPNASAIDMSATFWIETVQANIQVPVFNKGHAPVYIPVPPASPGAQPGPTFIAEPPHALSAPKTVTVKYTQIQYMQTVDLNFAGLTWPHVSCATLVPADPIRIPDSAFN